MHHTHRTQIDFWDFFQILRYSQAWLMSKYGALTVYPTIHGSFWYILIILDCEKGGNLGRNQQVTVFRFGNGAWSGLIWGGSREGSWISWYVGEEAKDNLKHLYVYQLYQTQCMFVFFVAGISQPLLRLYCIDIFDSHIHSRWPVDGSISI